MVDTAQALQLTQAADILLKDVDEVLTVLARRAVEHKDTLMMGRTHGIHAEPITFGLKLAIWWDEMRRNRRRLEDARDVMAVGKISGAVGTHATVPPSIEERVCAHLGLEVASVSNQVIQPRPACPIRHHPGHRRSVPGEVRHGDSRPPAHRGL